MTVEPKIAVFFDFENLALGVKEARYKEFEISKILQRLVEKGKIIIKRAYADWESYSKYKRTLHECGVELIYVPRRSYSGKNSADIRLVVDTLDYCFSKDHIDIFVVASGDSDFTSLVTKLRENNKIVIGLGVKNSTSPILIDNCDEFIFYEDVVSPPKKKWKLNAKMSKQKTEAFTKVLEAIDALVREDKDVIFASMVKQTIKRKYPDFYEGYYNYDSFSQLLVDMSKSGVIDIEKEKKSGGFLITAYKEK